MRSRGRSGSARVTVDEAPQAFVRVVVEVEGAWPRDRRHRRDDDAEMVRQEPGEEPGRTRSPICSASLGEAAGAYAGRAGTGTRPSAIMREASRPAEAGRRAAICRGSSANFGPALVDKAIARCRCSRRSKLGFAEGIAPQCLRHRCAADVRISTRREIADFLLAISSRSRSIAIRHTVGLLDDLEGAGGLAEDIRRAALRYFKIKIGGDVEADLDAPPTVTALLAAASAGFPRNAGRQRAI